MGKPLIFQNLHFLICTATSLLGLCQLSKANVYEGSSMAPSAQEAELYHKSVQLLFSSKS